MERDESQISFRVREERQKTDFSEALKKQKHVPSQAKFFASVMEAVERASAAGQLIEWPIELVVKKKKQS